MLDHLCRRWTRPRDAVEGHVVLVHESGTVLMHANGDAVVFPSLALAEDFVHSHLCGGAGAWTAGTAALAA